MYIISLLFCLSWLLCTNKLISCVLTETLKIFSTFCHFSFEGGGEGGSKRKLRELSFLSDIDILASPLNVSRFGQKCYH